MGPGGVTRLRPPTAGSKKVVAPLALARVVVSRLWFLSIMGTELVRIGAGVAQLRPLTV